MRIAIPLLVGLALTFLAPSEAAAHIEITSPTTRHGPGTQKAAPCGSAGAPGPGDTIYTYAPGQTITVSWFEFIDHPGHYRVAFDPSGTDDFITPASATDLYNSDAVLLDGIPDLPNVHDYEVEVTLPNVECDHCTLQILQVMTDKPPFGDGNDIYFHCVDLRLVAVDGDGDGDPGDGDPGDGDGEPGETEAGTDETGDPAPPLTAEEADSGCACTATPSSPLTAVPLAWLIVGLLRRRTSA
jgi:MYXO-CTERM domain-containing protein